MKTPRYRTLLGLIALACWPQLAQAQTYVSGRVDQLPGTSVVISSRSFPVFAIEFSGGGVATGDTSNGLDVDVTRLPALVAGNANIGDVDVASIAAGDNDIGNVDLEIAGVAIAVNAGAASAQTLRTITATDDLGVVGIQAIDASLPAVAALADNTTNPSLSAIAAYLMCFDGSTWDRCVTSQDWTVSAPILTTAPGQLLEAKDFDGAALPLTATAAEGEAIPVAGSLYGVGYTMLVSEDGSLQYGTSTTPFVTGGNVAHDAADSGNPMKIGAFAETSVSGATMVADADRTDVKAGIDGVLIERPHANLEDRVSGVAAVTDGSSTSLVAAQGSGVRFCATTLVVSNTSATDVAVDIRDGTAGSVIMTVPAAAHLGAVIPLQIPLCTTANTAMATDPSASASTVTTTAVGFKTKL